MNTQYNLDEDIGGGIYGMGKYHEKASSGHYKSENPRENNPKSNLDNPSTRCKFFQRVARKFKEKIKSGIEKLSTNEDITLGD
ncbi:MAG: hypothetical protein WD876_02230 [Candidatus Pacearchaeota archaeon]